VSYAHDAGCNINHTPGPNSCPSPRGEPRIETTNAYDSTPLDARLRRFYDQLLNGLGVAESGVVVGDQTLLRAVITDFEKAFYPSVEFVCPMRNDRGVRCRLSITHEGDHNFGLPEFRRVYMSRVTGELPESMILEKWVGVAEEQSPVVGTLPLEGEGKKWVVYREEKQP